MKGISTAILSKDRPLFLRDCLKSLRGMKLNITVFYLASEPMYEKAYLKIFRDVKNIKVVRQKGKLVDYMREWLNKANDYVFIGVDDNICKKPFDVESIIDFMEENDDIFAFNLAKDPSIKYSPDFHGSIGEYERHGNFIIYYPKTCYGMWDNIHAFEVSVLINRKEDIQRIWESVGANLINDLESDGRQHFLNVERMACFDYAPITNIHVDSMFSYNLPGISKRVTNEEALELYEKGMEIDIKKTFMERDRLETTNVTELFVNYPTAKACGLPA